MLRYIRTLPVMGLLLLCFQQGMAQKKMLTYNQAFERGEPQLTRFLASPIGWLDEDHYLVSDRVKDKLTIIKVNAISGDESVYFDFSGYNEFIPDGFKLTESDVNTPDYKKFIFSKDNDLYLFNTVNKEFRQLTHNPEEEKNPAFSPDFNRVAFTRDNDIYCIDLSTLAETRLTFDGSELIYNGWASWVYYEEILGRSSHYRAFWWSPDSKMIAFLRFDDSPVPVFPLFSADGIHGELEKARYPKPGDPNPLVKLGVIYLENKSALWLDDTEKEDHYIAWPFWSPDSKILVYQSLNRDQNDIRFIARDLLTGESREIYREHQETWVNFFEDIYVLNDGSGFILRSDKSGWRNLYYYDFIGNLIQTITSFNWEIRSVESVIEKTKTIYFTGTGGSSTESHLFSIKLNGKGFQQHTSIPGTHQALVSPDGKLFYDIYSDIHSPDKHGIFNLKGKSLRFVSDAKLPVMDDYALGKTELFTIRTNDGYDLPAAWILPPDFDENKQYPVIINVYGGPESSEVSNSYNFRLSNYFYAQNGIIVMSVDHRGSGHFGKEGSDYMHRNLGKWEMNDYTEAVRWLETKTFINRDKIGITGGSYGGYVTCMALTRGADYFNYGVAGYSVTDWLLYDNVYTERYMDTPDQNPEGYKSGSAMYHADKYKGKLLIYHGTMDDNVHMQNTIQFIDKLQDLGKDFEMMLYPGERHGWGGPKRQHLSRLTTQFWFENLLEKDFNPEE